MPEQLQPTESHIEKNSRIKRAAKFLLKAFVQKPVELQAVQAPISEELAVPAEKAAPTTALPQRTPSVETDSAFQSTAKVESDAQSTSASVLPQREKQETDIAFSYAIEKPAATNVIPLNARVVVESAPLPQRVAGGLDAFSYTSTKPRLISVPDVDPLTGPITVSENDPTPMFDAVASDAAVAHQEQLETPEFARLKAEFAARATEQQHQ